MNSSQDPQDSIPPLADNEVEAPKTAPPPDPAATVPPPKLAADEALELLQMDLERLIETYELEVACHHCQALHRRSIGWLRIHSTMECERCQSSIVLRTSLMNDEMRRVARQLRKLREQLAEMIQRASGILGGDG